MVNSFEQGDIIYLDFDPQIGHEQKGRRPAIIISNKICNSHCRLLMVCPISNTAKSHPFHIALDKRTQTTGQVLCDQCKMFDVESRNATRIEKVPQDILENIVDMVYAFIEII